MTVAENAETFDMGEFSLDDNSNASGGKSLFTQLTAGAQTEKEMEKASKSVVNQTFKEVVKTTAKKSEEQVTQHQEHVIMLSRYGQSKRFAEYLKSMGFQLTVSHLKGLDNEELKELLQRVKTSIDNKNVSNFWEEMVFGVIQTGEVIAVNTRLSQRLKIAGMTDALRGDDTFLDLIEQVELENQNLVYTSPYVRLVYSVATAAMKCHSINTMMEKRMKILNPETQTAGEAASEAAGEAKVQPESKAEVETAEDEVKRNSSNSSCPLSFD